MSLWLHSLLSFASRWKNVHKFAPSSCFVQSQWLNQQIPSMLLFFSGVTVAALNQKKIYSGLPTLKEFKPLVFALSETWLYEGSDFDIPGFNLIRGERNDSYGGVMIGVRQRVEFNQITLPKFSSIESVACVVRHKGLVFSVLSVYIPPNCRLVKSQFQQLIDCLTVSYFILGDFNAKGLAWGNKEDDSRSNIINDLIDENNLGLLNTGSITRIACPPSTCSSIDLSLVSTSIGLSCEWEVLNDTIGSDHLPIKVVWSVRGSLGQEYKVPYDLTKNVDWEKFSKMMSDQITQSSNMSNVSDKYSWFAQSVADSLNTAQLKPIPTEFSKKYPPNHCTGGMMNALF